MGIGFGFWERNREEGWGVGKERARQEGGGGGQNCFQCELSRKWAIHLLSGMIQHLFIKAYIQAFKIFLCNDGHFNKINKNTLLG